MNTFKIITLLSIVAFVSALPTRSYPTQTYNKLCNLLKNETGEPTFETQEYSDCLKENTCRCDEICCPKGTDGSKCISLSFFDQFNVKSSLTIVDKIKVSKPKYSKLCELVEDDSEEPKYKTQEYRNCLSESDKCKSDEICCPKKTSGSKCISLPIFVNIN